MADGGLVSYYVHDEQPWYLRFNAACPASKGFCASEEPLKYSSVHYRLRYRDSFSRINVVPEVEKLQRQLEESVHGCVLDLDRAQIQKRQY